MLDDYNDFIVDTFTSNIRNTLIIDDQYPTYEDFGSDSTSFREKKRALKLFKEFRKQGWTCDIENDVNKALQDERPNHLYQSDLIVLDYHLTASDDDGSKALEFINCLTVTPHFNTVILHTAAGNSDINELKKVAVEIFTHIQKCIGLSQNSDYTEILDFIDEVNEVSTSFFDDLKESVKNEEKISYFLGKKACIKNYPNLFSFLNTFDATVLNKTMKAKYKCSIGNIAKFILHNNLSKHISQKESDISIKIDISSENIWIEAGNLFLTIVGKNVEADQLLAKLKGAFVKWRPDPVKLILTRFQNSIEQNGLEYSNQLFPCAQTNASWVYQGLCANDNKKAVIDLSSKLFYHLGEKVLDNCLEDNSRFFKIMNATGVHNIMNSFYSVKPENQNHKFNLYKFINAYQCSHKTTTKHLTTGLVLKDINDSIWLVLNCSCDLVPNQTYGWSKKLAPWRPFTAVKLIKRSSIKEALESAEDGNDIYINENSSVTIYGFTKKGVNPHYETFYAENNGELSQDNKIIAKSVNSEQAGALILMDGQAMTAISQLRYEFACRFLNKLANHTSRIGVDFIAMP